MIQIACWLIFFYLFIKTQTYSVFLFFSKWKSRLLYDCDNKMAVLDHYDIFCYLAAPRVLCYFIWFIQTRSCLKNFFFTVSLYTGCLISVDLYASLYFRFSPLMLSFTPESTLAIMTFGVLFSRFFWRHFWIFCD